MNRCLMHSAGSAGGLALHGLAGTSQMPCFYEFFAGGGMARAGLGPTWTCLFANDFDEKKAASYRANWGGADLMVGDVAGIGTHQIPGAADLAWASFPCQDLSLAGAGAGLTGARSAAFWGFWKQIEGLRAAGRAPATIVLENVPGALASRGGRDFAALVSALTGGGYRCGALVINAAHFLPQSRPRLFVIGVREDIAIDTGAEGAGPLPPWHPQTLRQAFAQLPGEAKARWIWWRLPTPPLRNSRLADVIEERPGSVTWHSPAETAHLLAMMNDAHRDRVLAARQGGARMVGAIYRRTRSDGPGGAKAQRAEVRFDGMAGCLRTPSGGSSRQTILIIEGGAARSRLLSPREAARLMGLPDDYILPGRYGDAYRLAGDGVAVPVVSFIARNILEPVLARAAAKARQVA